MTFVHGNEASGIVLDIRCILSGLVRILQAEERFPSDFTFGCPNVYDEDSLMLASLRSFLSTYMICIDSWPGFSIWEAVGPFRFLRCPYARPVKYRG